MFFPQCLVLGLQRYNSRAQISVFLQSGGCRRRGVGLGWWICLRIIHGTAFSILTVLPCLWEHVDPVRVENLGNSLGPDDDSTLPSLFPKLILMSFQLLQELTYRLVVK